MTTDLEPRTRGDGGMTLIEVLAALLIMGVVLAGLGAAGIAGLTSVRSEKDQLTATQVTSKIVESLRAASWTSVAPVDPATTVTYTGPAAAATTVGSVTYTPTVQVDWMDDACNGTSTVQPPAPPASPGPHAARDFLRFTVTLNWTDAKGRAKRTVTETYRAPTYAERRPALVDTLGSSC